MNMLEHLLTALGEEGCEVGQRAAKALRFGANETQPGQTQNNTQRLVGEINDLLGVVELLHERGLDMSGVGDRAAISAKKAKVMYFAGYAEELGTLKLDAK